MNFRVVGSHESIGKHVFEAELEDGTAAIGKRGEAGKLTREHRALQALWGAGLAVSRPIALLDDCLLAEKVPGEPLESLLAANKAERSHFHAAGSWLATLHASDIDTEQTIDHF